MAASAVHGCVGQFEFAAAGRVKIATAAPIIRLRFRIH